MAYPLSSWFAREAAHLGLTERASQLTSFMERNRTTLVILVAVVGGCDQATDQVDDSLFVSEINTQTDTAQREPILFAVSGGWMSCRNGHPNQQFVSAQFDNLLSDMRAKFLDKDIYGMSSCLGFRAPIDRTGPFGRRQIQTGELTFSYSGSPQKYQSPARDWNQRIRERADSLGITPGHGKIFLIGHSYGGWQVMEQATKPALSNSGLNIAGVFSLEPVSAGDCTVEDYLKNNPPVLAMHRAREGKLALRNTRRPRIRMVDGCRRAPIDTQNSLLSAVTNNNWFNLHLPESQWRGHTHAGPAHFAHNITIPVDSELPHHDFGFSPDVWQQVCCLSTKAIAPNTSTEGTCTRIQVGENGALTSRNRSWATCGI